MFFIELSNIVTIVAMKRKVEHGFAESVLVITEKHISHFIFPYFTSSDFTLS